MISGIKYKHIDIEVYALTYLHTYINTYYKGTIKTILILLQQYNNYENICLYVYKYKNKIKNKFLFVNNHALGFVNLSYIIRHHHYKYIYIYI